MKIIRNIKVAVIVLLLTTLVSNSEMWNVHAEELESNFLNVGYDLPIIIIDTLGNRINEVELQKAKLYIIDNEDQLNYLDDEPTFLNDIGIKIRGKSTKAYPKKQYKVELWNEDGNDVKHSLLGLTKESDWVLDGPFKDKSLMRNQLAFSIARKMMVYAPETKYCEIFVVDDGSTIIEDKHFRGLYLLKENIKKSENRVNLFPSYKGLAETSFLASKDVPREHDITVNTYGKDTIMYPKKIELKYPKKILSDEQFKYITRTISEFERVLYSDNYNSDGEGYEEYIIVESFIDYYIINEFFRNRDAGIYSTYFSKDYGEKIRLGPVWDFNESMGNDLDGGDYFDYTGFHISENFWFKRLMTDKEFVSQVISRYHLLRKTFLSDDYLLEEIDELKIELRNTSTRNFKRWPFELCSQTEIFDQTWIGLLGTDKRAIDYTRMLDKIILELKKYDDYESDPVVLLDKTISELKKYDAYASDPVVLLELLQRYDHLKVETGIITIDYDDEITKLKEFIVNRGEWMDDNIEYLLRFTY